MQSESIKEVMKAIQNVQQMAGAVEKSSEGQVGTRKYNYAGLNEVWETVKPLLKTNGLVIMQSPSMSNHGANIFKTKIYHVESEQWIEEEMPMIITKDDPQSMGSAITYYRRYMLMSMLGLIPEEDNDAKEHRLATAQQKQALVLAIKRVQPDLEKPQDIVDAIMKVTGKHPSNIREDEADKYVELINAFEASK